MAFPCTKAMRPTGLTALMSHSPAELTDQDRHMFLGHFPLEVRLAEPFGPFPAS